LHHGFQHLAILALTLSIGGGPMPDDPAGTDSPRPAANTPATPPSAGHGPDLGDGLVPYACAHDPGATSEFVVTAGHICLANPDVIGEVARILKDHATHGDPPIRVPEARGRSREM
jgi:hypothetical protein